MLRRIYAVQLRTGIYILHSLSKRTFSKNIISQQKTADMVILYNRSVDFFVVNCYMPASCRSRLRSRAVKRAYFILTYTAMHAHPVRRRTAPVSYVRRHAPYGALYGYCIKIYKFFFLSNFAAPNI